MSWNAFALLAASDALQLLRGFLHKREEFCKKKLIGMKFRVHMDSVNYGLACAVIKDCPFCYNTSHKMPEDMRNEEYLDHNLYEAITRLDSHQSSLSCFFFFFDWVHNRIYFLYQQIRKIVSNPKFNCSNE